MDLFDLRTSGPFEVASPSGAQSKQEGMMAATPKYPPIIVRRYARSRLYDTAAGRYLTVDDLRQWLKDGVAFQVHDRETGEDITRVLLA